MEAPGEFETTFREDIAAVLPPQNEGVRVSPRVQQFRDRR